VNPLSAAEHDLLRALLDRLIPADDFPGAAGTGVENYVTGQLAGALSGRAGMVAEGLRGLEAEAKARHGKGFLELDGQERDLILADVESGRAGGGWPVPPAAFFDLMVNLAAEGYYADPGNGGNRDGASWKMLGYDPRVGPRGGP
jgi:hypothetical protein